MHKFHYFLLLLGVVGIGTYVLISTHKKGTLVLTATSTPNQTSVQYYCSEGKMLAATFSNNSLLLTAPDATSSITLPQVVSGSGIRYVSGDNEFVGKGADAIFLIKSLPRYDHCTAGTLSNSNGNKIFTDSSKLFQFSYPESLSLEGGGIGFDTNWSANTAILGKLLAVVIVPKTLQPNTNLSDSKFTVGTSADPQAVSTCLAKQVGSSLAPKAMTINGVQFSVSKTSDAGAGNLYNTTLYRTVRDNQCYSIEYTIHSTNLGNYSPDQGIKAFDQAKIQTMFESMVASFKFL